MARNGSGTYSLPNPAVVTGTTISSTWANSTLSDIATALTNSTAANGETPLTDAAAFRLKQGFSADTYLGGVWTTPAFDAGNFTGNGSMTWTVESGDVATYAYIINGKTMTVAFGISGTTVGGTPASTLQIAIPASKVSTKGMSNALSLAIDNTTAREGRVTVSAGGTVISCTLTSQSEWSASTNNTAVFGQITFEIN
jgi:hypothetical protein